MFPKHGNATDIRGLGMIWTRNRALLYDILMEKFQSTPDKRILTNYAMVSVKGIL
jgi:hypothetical protein